MGSKQFHFFATKSDQKQVLDVIESTGSLKYIRCGLFDSPEPIEYNSLIDWEGLGFNEFGDTAPATIFMVLGRHLEVKVRAAPQRKGGVKYPIDQLENQETIVFRPSGLYEETNLIAGNCGTAYGDNPISLELFKLFRKHFVKKFTTIGNYFVGDEAQKLMKEETRMVTVGVRSPREYDLKLL